MPKLSNLQSRLGSLQSRVSAPQEHKRTSTSRYGSEPWQAWYKGPRWKKLRKQVLIRDAYKCQRTGALCIGGKHAPNSPVVHHIKAHHGNPDLFWDIDNLQTVTKAYHDSELQKQERKDIKGTWY